MKNVKLGKFSIIQNFFFQIALVNILYELEIRPNFIIGHSIGELGCAYADDSLTLEQTVLATYWRGKSLLMTNIVPGAMAAVG